MTDSPEFRRWAESAHRDSLKKPRRKKNCRYRCAQCSGRTTHNQARKRDFHCVYCRAPLRCRERELRKAVDISQEIDYKYGVIASVERHSDPRLEAEDGSATLPASTMNGV